MTTTSACPCGSDQTYDACCRRFHRGEAAAATPEILMRSRFSAFVKRDVSYLMRTTHPSTRTPMDLADFADIAWTRLDVLDTAPGIVEFDAHYTSGGRAGTLHERSRFVEEDGAWFYLDGDTSVGAGPTRSAPCPCGSGKKFKRCCGVGR